MKSIIITLNILLVTTWHVFWAVVPHLTPPKIIEIVAAHTIQNHYCNFRANMGVTHWYIPLIVQHHVAINWKIGELCCKM